MTSQMDKLNSLLAEIKDLNESIALKNREIAILKHLNESLDNELEKFKSVK